MFFNISSLIQPLASMMMNPAACLRFIPGLEHLEVRHTTEERLARYWAVPCWHCDDKPDAVRGTLDCYIPISTFLSAFALHIICWADGPILDLYRNPDILVPACRGLVLALALVCSLLRRDLCRFVIFYFTVVATIFTAAMWCAIAIFLMYQEDHMGGNTLLLATEVYFLGLLFVQVLALHVYQGVFAANMAKALADYHASRIPHQCAARESRTECVTPEPIAKGEPIAKVAEGVESTGPSAASKGLLSRLSSKLIRRNQQLLAADLTVLAEPPVRYVKQGYKVAGVLAGYALTHGWAFAGPILWATVSKRKRPGQDVPELSYIPGDDPEADPNRRNRAANPFELAATDLTPPGSPGGSEPSDAGYGSAPATPERAPERAVEAERRQPRTPKRMMKKVKDLAAKF